MTVLTMIRIAFVALIVFAAGCSEKKSEDASLPPPAHGLVIPPVSGASSAAVKPKCPHTGKWALCNIEQRLRQSGFVAKRDSSSQKKRDGFSVIPMAFSIGKQSRLEVFIYPDEKSLSKDLAKLDTVRVAPIGGTPAWNGTPTFIRSANLLAVFVTDNPRQIERMSLAITAGPPQPDSPR